MKEAVRSKTPNLIREAKDPHHIHLVTWGYDGYDFWTLHAGQSKWTKSYKSHLTEKRVKMFYYLVTGEEYNDEV